MADQRILYTEQLVGSGHPTKADTINRLALVEHNADGTHKPFIDPYRDPRADGASGDGVTDDKAALDLTFAHPVIQFPEGTFTGYDLSLAGVNAVTGMGQGSVIKCNSLAADYVMGFQTTGQSTLYIDKLVIDGNKSLGTFTGSGHGVDIRGYDEVNIGWLEVKNAWGHGVVIADCNNVNIGTLIVHDNYKFGVAFSDNQGVGAAENIAIGTLVAYNNGADVDGVGVGNDYSGISFGDKASDAVGARRIVIGKVISHDNARDGIAFGVNATSGETGPSEIVVGEMLLYSNNNHGAELYGCHNVAIGSIVAHSNAYDGVAVLHGDYAPGPWAYCENVSIGNIVSYNNNWHGVEVTGGKKLHIDSIISYNNSQAGAGTYDGLYIHETGAASGTSHNTDIVIDKLHAYDDQVTHTQRYGLNVKQTLSEGRNHVRHFIASGNSAGDYNLTWPASVFNPINLNGKWHSYKTTTDATANVVAFKSNPMPANTIWLCRGIAIGVDSATGGVRGIYHFESIYRKHGAGAIAVMGTSVVIHSVETDTGLDAAFGTDGVDRVVVAVTGKAATTMLWKIYVEIDSSTAY